MINITNIQKAILLAFMCGVTVWMMYAEFRIRKLEEENGS